MTSPGGVHMPRWRTVHGPTEVGRYRPSVLSLGLTGGIGSGKSTVSAMLEEHGAVVVDADRIVRALQEPGQPVFEAMVEEFGQGIVSEDGTLDRQAVADIVFADEGALKRLNAIVHPAVGAAMAERIAELAGTDAVVVLDIPLLVESGRDDMAAVIVVDVDPDVAVRRLVEHRGFTEDDARARMARQVSRDERVARADVVLDNSGSLEDLRAQVDQLWQRIAAGEFEG
jgi:dephospho-CoA kinase